MIIVISRDIGKGFYPPKIKKWIEYSGDSIGTLTNYDIQLYYNY